MDQNHTPQDEIQSEGREKNAALPLNAAKPNAGPERYPQVRQDDGVGTRTFAPRNPQPRQGAGDGGPAPDGRQGPDSDPVDGRR